MHMVAVPMFDDNRQAQAYMFRFMRANNLFSTAQATNVFDGASNSEALETISSVGLEAFTLGKPLFVPIDDYMLMGHLDKQCAVSADKIIFLFEAKPKQDASYLFQIKRLRALGFRFAVNYPVGPEQQDAVLPQCSYIFLSQRSERVQQSEKTLAWIRQQHRQLAPVALHIYSEEVLQGLRGKGYALYESRFYKPKANGAPDGLPPLKVNAIRLINTVQDENFDFKNVSEIVQGDPALTISLLSMVNARAGVANKIRTITQAVAMLGQAEVRKWVTTAVSKSLGDDRPNELTRMSLIRAKFAENLAPLFELAHMSGELFLMGLFSVLDLILDMPMEQALGQVLASDTIKSALISDTGIFAPVLKMIHDYEGSFWSEVSRGMLVNDIEEDALSEAYISALLWYRNMTLASQEAGKPEPVET